MINALTPVSSSRALQRIRRIEATGDDRAPAAGTGRAIPVPAVSPLRNRPHAGSSAAFFAQQATAHDAGFAASTAAAAHAYRDMHYRLADLPIGFLISKIA